MVRVLGGYGPGFLAVVAQGGGEQGWIVRGAEGAATVHLQAEQLAVAAHAWDRVRNHRVLDLQYQDEVGGLHQLAGARLEGHRPDQVGEALALVGHPVLGH